MRLHTPLSILGITTTIVLILGATVIAAPISPPPGGYTGGIFSYYFKNIIEGSGSIVGTTSGGVCPAGRVVTGFSTGTSTYGLPICSAITPDDGTASSLTGSLRGTVNYVPKYGLTNTGLINSLIFDNGTNIGIGTSTGTVKLSVLGGIRALGGSTFAGANGYTFSSPGDTDGGMFSPADGTVVFATNNVERLRIASNGNIAIGTGITTAARFTVDGGDALINGVLVGKGGGNIAGNTAVGTDALLSNSTGTTNTAIGYRAIYLNTTGLANTAVGMWSLRNNNTGSSNTAIGKQAGENLTSGSTNIAIGSNTLFPSSTGSNQLNIGNWIYGSGGSIGIGDSTPSYRLDVAGTGAFYGLRVTSGAVNNYVLTSDASGNARWLATQSTNGGISSGTTAFAGPLIGTINYLPKYSAAGTGVVNSQIFDNATNVGIGTATPGAKLEVAGQVKITGGSPGAGKFLVSDATGLASWTGSINESDPKVGTLALNYTPKWGGTTLTNSLIYDNGISIGIGTSAPAIGAKLDILGKVKIVDGTQGGGKVLKSDAAGLASWEALPADLPIGTVMAFNDVACPAGWAVADGTSGTPDLRGEFVRGLDMSRGIDAGRVLGTTQADAIKEGSFIIDRLGNAGSTVTIFGTVTGSLSLTQAATTVGPGQNFGFLTAAAQPKDRITIGSGNTETRPRNVALLYCQKMTVYATPGDPSTWQNLSGTASGNVTLATTGMVGVGTNTPTEKLEVAGSIKIVDGSQGTGKVLISDGTGKGTWETMPGDLPIGTVMAFNDVACPAGWVVADGTSGTPDLRGEFVRGLDMSRGVDTGRVLGSPQNGSYVPLGHAGGAIWLHYLDDTTGTQNYWYKSAGSVNTQGGINAFDALWATAATSYSNSSAAGGGAGTTTFQYGRVRPRNVALLYCMKMTSYATPGDPNTWSNTSGTSSGNVSLATTGNVGVGTTTPTEKLEVAGSVKIVDGNQGAGKVLVSDTDGKGTWQEMPGDLPTGSVMAFNSASCPAGWVIANGTSGTPDLRGEFVRGLDVGRGVDTGRVLKSYQKPTQIRTLLDVWGTVPTGSLSLYGVGAWNVDSDGLSGVSEGTKTYTALSDTNYYHTTALTVAIGAGDNRSFSTRPRNVALLYCMKISASPPTESNSGTWMNIDGTSSGRVVLATTGDVGIGTATPTSKLEILDATNMPAVLDINSRVPLKISDGATAILIDPNQIESVGSALNINYRTTTQNTTIAVGGGNVGIGASSPGAKLDVTGHTRSTSFEAMDSGTPTVSFHKPGVYATQIKLNASNQLSFGGWSAGEGQASIVAGAFYYGSDRRLKTDIIPLKNTLEKILSLNGYSFSWKKDGRKDIGVIAQEVESIFPELVSTNPETGMKSVQYGNLVAPIIEAIKELAAQVKSLHTLIEEQQSDIRKLQSENRELKARLDAIEARLAQ